MAKKVMQAIDSSSAGGMEAGCVVRFSFGSLSDGRPVQAVRVDNGAGACLTVLEYGAVIQSLVVPDRNGDPVDVVLGYDTAAEYEKNDGYLGAAIGRVGNRIGGAVFSLDGKTYQLAKNDGDNTLHGGWKGFDKQMWSLKAREAPEGGGAKQIVCSRVSPDGEENYPGTLQVTVTYTLTRDKSLRIDYEALSDKDTLVNLTNHSYFNLNGAGTALDHTLQVFAERFCENDEACLPTGVLLDVEGTPFDFRQEKPVGRDIGEDHIQLKRAGGYDHNYCLAGKRAAVLYSPQTGIEMTTYTDLPGMQVYTANFITRRPGKRGTVMDYRGAVCLETQLYPNAMQCWGFPSPVLRAGRKLHSTTCYSFRVRPLHF